MSSSASFQGRLFAERLFPCPTEESRNFSCKSRCLIDMNNNFIVIPQGDNLQPFQRVPFRLEGLRSEMEFADNGESALSKEECKNILEAHLASLPYCEIVKVRFPYFAQGEIQQTKVKFRPCLALYREGDVPPLYIGVYMGAPRDGPTGKFELLLQPTIDLQPAHSSSTIVDCSKLCGFPDAYNRPDTFFDGMPTWKPFLLDPNGSKTALSNRLRGSPEALRNNVVSKLIDLLVHNPHMDYVDTTIKYDIGTIAEYEMQDDDGEWCEYEEVYKGPPKQRPVLS